MSVVRREPTFLFSPNDHPVSLTTDCKIKGFSFDMRRSLCHTVIKSHCGHWSVFVLLNLFQSHLSVCPLELLFYLANQSRLPRLSSFSDLEEDLATPRPSHFQITCTFLNTKMRFGLNVQLEVNMRRMDFSRILNFLCNHKLYSTFFFWLSFLFS